VGEENGKPIVRLRRKWLHERFGSAARNRTQTRPHNENGYKKTHCIDFFLRVRTQWKRSLREDLYYSRLPEHSETLVN
jgi:hypothetical protein